MTGKVSAEQVINLWKNAHGVEMSKLALDKLMIAVNIIAEAAYNVGKQDAVNAIHKIGAKTDGGG